MLHFYISLLKNTKKKHKDSRENKIKRWLVKSFIQCLNISNLHYKSTKKFVYRRILSTKSMSQRKKNTQVHYHWGNQKSKAKFVPAFQIAHAVIDYLSNSSKDSFYLICLKLLLLSLLTSFFSYFNFFLIMFFVFLEKRHKSLAKLYI